MADVVEIDLPTVDRQAAPAHLSRQEILGRVLGTAHGRKLHQFRREIDGLVEPLVDGAEKGKPRRGVEFGHRWARMDLGNCGENVTAVTARREGLFTVNPGSL